MNRVALGFATMALMVLFLSALSPGVSIAGDADPREPTVCSRPLHLTPHASAKVDPAILFAVSEPQKTPSHLAPIGRRIVLLAGPSGEVVLPVLIRTELTDAELSLLGAIPDSRIGGIVTARIAMSDLEKVAEHPLVDAIEASYWMKSDLDVSIPEVRADLINEGTPPNGYTGDGVIYGLMDDGIDITHADFQDGGGGSRILYIWDHYRDGNAPSGYSYGYEYTKANIDGGQATQFVNTGGHGSHVAGISVGDGSSLASLKYRGVAWEADIIHVRNGYCDLFCYGGGMPPYGNQDTKGSIDGLNWMLQKAAALGKPLVVNQSQGTMMGPHDGTTLLESAYNNLITNDGLIICIAAGNDQDADWHGKASVSGGGTGTFVLNLDTSEQGSAYIYWDCWYPQGKAFRWEIVNPAGGTQAINSSYTEQEFPGWYFTTGQPDTIWAWSTTSSAINGQGYCYMWVQNRTQGVAGGNWTVRAIDEGGSGGVVDLYCERNQYTLKVTTGLNTEELVGMPGTCTNAITVASYNTKLDWDAIDGQHYQVNGENPVDDISSFSSNGPRRDGAEKPDIAAPGSWIMSTWADQNQTSESQIDPGGQHKIISGTSMATPHVSGAIALMLQKDPSLTPAEVKTILQNTARTDAYTGSVWNKAWGYGKLDVKAAVDEVGGGGGGDCPTTSGDATGDGTVNVLDIVAVVNHILDTTPLDADGQACADVNGDQTINVLDLVGIVNIILDGKRPAPVADEIGESFESPVAWGEGIEEDSYRLFLEGDRVAGFEMMFILPRGYELTGEPVLRNCTSAARTLHSERVGQHTILAYTPDGGSLASADEPLVVEIPVAHRWDGGQNLDDLAVTRIVLADPAGQDLSLAEQPSLGEKSGPTSGGLSSALARMRPNPMQDVSRVSYRLAADGPVSLAIYDGSGRLIRNLYDGWQIAGEHTLAWDGQNDAGLEAGAGVYFIRLQTKDGAESRKISLIR